MLAGSWGRHQRRLLGSTGTLLWLWRSPFVLWRQEIVLALGLKWALGGLWLLGLTAEQTVSAPSSFLKHVVILLPDGTQEKQFYYIRCQSKLMVYIFRLFQNISTVLLQQKFSPCPKAEVPLLFPDVRSQIYLSRGSSFHGIFVLVSKEAENILQSLKSIQCYLIIEFSSFTNFNVFFTLSMILFLPVRLFFVLL